MSAQSRAFKILSDLFNVAIFVLAVVVGAFLLNTFIFQSYSVFGASMEPSLSTGDRLVVNKIPVTISGFRSGGYEPKRGQIIVFKNASSSFSSEGKHLVKRVIGLPGERVVVENGSLKVFNDQYPDGFEPDQTLNFTTQGPNSPVSGNIEINVPKGEVFVAGDNRVGSNSFDSRNGLGTVALDAIEGPVFVRLLPIENFQLL